MGCVNDIDYTAYAHTNVEPKSLDGDSQYDFLRSNDIDTVEFDEEKNLVLKMVDGEKIVVNVAESLVNEPTEEKKED